MTNPIQARHEEGQQRTATLRHAHCDQGNHLLGPVLGPNLQRAYAAQSCCLCHQEFRYEPVLEPVQVDQVLRFPAHHFGTMTQSQIRRLLGLPRTVVFTHDVRRHTLYILVPAYNTRTDIEAEAEAEADDETEESH